MREGVRAKIMKTQQFRPLPLPTGTPGDHVHHVHRAPVERDEVIAAFRNRGKSSVFDLRETPDIKDRGVIRKPR